jgi:hypothetical protein
MRFIPIFLLFLLSKRISAQQVDTIYSYKLNEVDVHSTRKWDNDTAWYRYNQLKYYVKIVMPYVLEATRTFNEITEETSQPGTTRKDRKRIVAKHEDVLRTRFEDKVRSLNETQGILIVKLVARQTAVNIYSILDDFKNPLIAMKWQAWSRLHGFNLNRRYDPADEPLLEMVMNSLGYPLPGTTPES